MLSRGFSAHLLNYLLMIMKNRFLHNKLIILLLIIYTSIISSFAYADSLETIKGQVLDIHNNQIVGATVLLENNNKVLKGMATDNEGRFQFFYEYKNPLLLRVKAIGYKQYTAVIGNKRNITIKLQEDFIEMAPISVTTAQDMPIESEAISQKQFSQRSQNSIITNNPINAVKQPQLVKQGSSLSSKLRINGTSPSYYFHNSPIGYDPNHYGMFSVIPSSVVSNVKFYPNGTPAAYQLPSVIDLTPKKEFNNHQEKSLEFSFVQTTGTFSYGNNNFYTIGTMRKSVLDKLVKYFDIESDRRTIPPTNFKDIVLSSGYKINSNSKLFIDQFYTRDYLAYNTGPTTHNKYGLDTYQHTKTAFVGMTYQLTKANTLLEAKLSSRGQSEEFEATPPYENLQGLDLRLQETKQQYNSSVVFSRFYSKVDISSGLELSYTPYRKTELRQINWNHKSPDATDNNPFVYQYELNKLFDRLLLEQKDLFTAAYTQVSFESKKFKLNSGIRFERFSNLKENKQILFRKRITYFFNKTHKLTLYIGTFSESPIKNILENYQVLVRKYQTDLTPQKTKLFSLAYQRNSIKISLFKKNIRNIAVPIIDYSKVISKKLVSDGFIRMSSNGSLDFVGGDISYERNKFILSKLDLYTFYGYTKAKKESNGYESVYELNAPHKFMAELTYTHSQRLSFGSEFNFHSGFAYTPYIEQYNYSKEERYTESYYQNIQSFENTKYFKSYYSLNFFINYKFSGKELNFSVSNITNRANPVVHTSDGYIYDPGVMPSIGFNWKL